MAVLVPVGVDRRISRSASTSTGNAPPPATALTWFKQPVRNTVSFSTSINATVPHRRPTSAFDPSQADRFGCRLVLGQGDRTGRPVGDLQPVQSRQRGVQLIQRGNHLGAQLVDEDAWVQRFAQLSVVLVAALVEVGWQVLLGLRQESAPTTQISLQRSCSRSAWKVATPYTIRVTRSRPRVSVR
jgi:hypothetical protein